MGIVGDKYWMFFKEEWHTIVGAGRTDGNTLSICCQVVVRFCLLIHSFFIKFSL